MGMVEKNLGIADWAELREQAMALIQVMNVQSRQWTDYNTHDPGITLLETLCYAISDLSNRIALPIEDLLCPAPTIDMTDAQTNSQGVQQTFFTAQQALPNAPLTLDDYRRWLIDQSGVNNAWLHYNAQSASYFVYLYLDSSDNEGIEKEVTARIDKEVNIGERFALVKALPLVPVNICIDLTLSDNANQSVVKATLFQCVSQFFSLAVSSKSFSQMGSLGKSVESTLAGPTPVNGFVTQEALIRTDVDGFDGNIQPEFRYNFLELEEIIKKIRGINAVNISSLTVGDNECKFDKKSPEKIYIVVGKIASIECASVNLKQNGFADVLKNKFEPNQGSIKQASNIQIEFPQGQYQDLSGYTSIQDDLPEYYGLAQNPLSVKQGADISLECSEQEKVTQLKNYLTLFDQTLCDYFSQLGHVNGMLAMRQPPKQEPPLACFTQKLPDSALTNSADFYSSLQSRIDSSQPQLRKKNFEQKNALLDHLLAMFSEIYIPQNIYIKLNETNANNIEDTNYVYDKQQYLNTIVLLRAGRSQLQTLTRIIALKLALTDEEVLITDLVTAQPLPIPCIEISSDAKKSPKHRFTVADSPTKWLFKIKVQIPYKFKLLGNSDPRADSLNSYAKSILNAEIPAHIYYEIEYSAPTTNQAASA